jgi:hypothetical protein
MKTKFYISYFGALFILFNGHVIAQTNIFPSTGAAGIGTTSPDPSCLFEVVSTSKGILIPRMTQTQRDAIVTPSTGLFIFQTNNSPGFYYYNGSTWTAVSPKGVSKTLNNLTAPTAVNQSLIPGTTNSIDLGSSSILWRNAYFSGDALINGLTVGLGGGGKSTNTTIGFQALLSNTTGASNTVTGNKALFSNTTGSFNTAYGLRALYSNTAGYSNVAIGIRSLYSNTIASNIVAVGDSALYNNGIGTTFFFEGSFNTGIGSKALYSNTSGYSNTANGFQALYLNTTGKFNTASGFQALDSNTTGEDNTAAGYQALNSNSTGGGNTAAGFRALWYNTEGAANTAFGSQALYFNTGTGNTALGASADVAGDLTNSMALGYGTYVSASNTVEVGNDNVSVIGGHVGWSTFSDGRFKTNIKENVPGLLFINKLKPVTYNIELEKFHKFQGRQDDGMKILHEDRPAMETKIRTGFIAQDVEKSAEEIGYDFDGINHPQHEKDNYSLVYADFVPSLVKAVQELSKMNDEKDSQLANLKKQNDAQQKTNADLQKQIDELKELIVSNQSTVNSQQSTVLSSVSLSQNIPNPFNHTTTINYTLPQQYSSAKIVVTDQTGKILKQVHLSAKGSGSVTLDASTLSSGAYQYSLYLDSRLIDTKQMEHIK